MAITPVDLTNTFDVWRTRTNQLITLAESTNTAVTSAFTKANAVGAGANAFASATVAGANTAVGTGANAFTSATIAGANTAVGTGANAFATAATAGANNFMIAVQNGSNTAIGSGANAFTSATIAGANTAVGTGANAFTSTTVAGANAFTSATIAGANTAVGAGANTVAIAAFAKANLTTFSSNLVISVTDNTNAALRITQTGAGDALRVEDSASTDTSPFVVTGTGNVGIGITTPTSNLHVVGTANITTLNVTTLNVTTITTSTGARVGVANVQTFNASGTWTKPTGYDVNSRVHVQAWGGGGSGAKASTSITGAGGGGGAYVERWLNLSQLAATETVTIGTGGASRSVNFSGASGSNTTVGTLITAYGGGGGGNASFVFAGTGGGQLSQGNIGHSTLNRLPGRPYILAGVDFLGSNAGGYSSFDQYASTGMAVYLGSAGATFSDASCCGDNFVFPTPDTQFHGGAGGYSTSWKNGASSVWGGAGGGGGDGGGLGGTSVNGGNGGNAGTTGTAGTQPGGGGGSSSSGNSGAGGDGRVIITIFPG